MRLNRLYLLKIAVGLTTLVAVNAHAVLQCEDLFGGARSYWFAEKPSIMRDSKGKGLGPLSYSFDSEISVAEMYRIISKDDRALLSLRRRFQNGENGSRWEPRPIEHYLNILGKSEKQFRQFVLKRGTDPQKNEFTVFDFNPAYFEFVFRKTLAWELSPEGISDRAILGLLEADRSEYIEKRDPLSLLVREFTHTMRKMGYPVKGHVDDADGELTHHSSDVIPSRFARLIGRMHSEIKNPNTHLHIGIPADLSVEKTMAIARAVETRITIKMAEEWTPGEGNLAYHGGSSFSTTEIAWLRGVLRLDLNEFKKPVPAHNLEIRQWTTIEEGLDHLALASKMALAHDRIIIQRSFQSVSIQDGQLGALNGALRYAGVFLSGRKAADGSDLGETLKLLGEKLERQKSVSEAEKKEISRLLQRNKVYDLLSESLFLRQAH